MKRAGLATPQKRGEQAHIGRSANMSRNIFESMTNK